MEQVTAPTSESAGSDPPVPIMESRVPSIVPALPSDSRPEGTITVEPRVLRVLGPQPRSIARRIAGRLVLGVAALALFGVWIWMAGQTPLTTNSSPPRGTIAAPETVAPPEPVAPITNAESKSLMPAWFLPQMIDNYATTITPSPAAPSRAEVPVPIPRPTPR
jgi:hypothetical protein